MSSRGSVSPPGLPSPAQAHPRDGSASHCPSRRSGPPPSLSFSSLNRPFPTGVRRKPSPFPAVSSSQPVFQISLILPERVLTPLTLASASSADQVSCWVRSPDSQPFLLSSATTLPGRLSIAVHGDMRETSFHRCDGSARLGAQEGLRDHSSWGNLHRPPVCSVLPCLSASFRVSPRASENRSASITLGTSFLLCVGKTNYNLPR